MFNLVFFVCSRIYLSAIRTAGGDVFTVGNRKKPAAGGVGASLLDEPFCCSLLHSVLNHVFHHPSLWRLLPLRQAPEKGADGIRKSLSFQAPQRLPAHTCLFPKGAGAALGAPQFCRLPSSGLISRRCLRSHQTACTFFIAGSYTRPGFRRTFPLLPQCSVNREISLSFGERPLTSYPSFRSMPVQDCLPANSTRHSEIR